MYGSTSPRIKDSSGTCTLCDAGRLGCGILTLSAPRLPEDSPYNLPACYTTTDSWYSPNARRNASEISPTVTRASTAARIAGIKFSLLRARRSTSLIPARFRGVTPCAGFQPRHL